MANLTSLVWEHKQAQAAKEKKKRRRRRKVSPSPRRARPLAPAPYCTGGGSSHWGTDRPHVNGRGAKELARRARHHIGDEGVLAGCTEPKQLSPFSLCFTRYLKMK